MKNRYWNVEHALYALALFLALSFRLINLGETPLSDFESRWALQALSLARPGEQVLVVGPQPGYVLLTSLLFSVLGAGNTIARLLPAFMGSLLVLLPLFFRDLLGRRAAILAAFGLALDPGLVALSRLAGGPMPAVSFCLLALALLFFRRPVWAGVFGGLAILSGTPLWVGILALAIAWLLGSSMEPAGLPAFPWNPVLLSRDGNPRRIGPVALMFLAGTLVFGGTLFFRFPQGLGGLAGSLPEFFQGWLRTGDVPALRLLVALLVYQPLALVIALVGQISVWRGNGERAAFYKFLSIWGGLALLVAILYPHRQISDLAWVLVPMWALAAGWLAENLSLEGDEQNRWVVLAHTGLLVSLLIFAWVNLTSVARLSVTLDLETMRNAAILIIGSILMAFITSVLVIMGWSWKTAKQGLVWGLVLILGTYTLSGMLETYRWHENGETSLWNPAPAVRHDKLLSSTLEDLSLWETGQPKALDLAVMLESPSIRWILRDWAGAKFMSGVPVAEQPSIILTTSDQEFPSLASSYRGQDFVWEVYPDWQGALPPNPLRWLIFRDAPQQENQVILWAKTELFPGGSATSQTSSIPR